MWEKGPWPTKEQVFITGVCIVRSSSFEFHSSTDEKLESMIIMNLIHKRFYCESSQKY